jgi:hypothetical protein
LQAGAREVATFGKLCAGFLTWKLFPTEKVDIQD